MHVQETFDIKAKHIDQLFQIQIALPTSYDRDTNVCFPLMYVTDGHLLFRVATTTMLLSQDPDRPNISQSIIVAIGYPDSSKIGLARTRDLTPEIPMGNLYLKSHADSESASIEAGGADALIGFIENELHPLILERYRVAGDTAAIMGHSLGGLFTFYTFLKQIPLFDRFWLGSPGELPRRQHLLEELTRVLAEGIKKPTRVFLTLGELERNSSINQLLPEGTLQEPAGDYDAIHSQFSNCQNRNLRFAAKEFDDETHSSVIPAAFSRAYRFLMRRD